MYIVERSPLRLIPASDSPCCADLPEDQAWKQTFQNHLKMAGIPNGARIAGLWSESAVPSVENLRLYWQYHTEETEASEGAEKRTDTGVMSFQFDIERNTEDRNNDAPVSGLLSIVRPYHAPSPTLAKLRKYSGSIISIDGLIGAGKTSLGNSMVCLFHENGLEARLFLEYINLPLLKLMIADMDRYAFAFQMVMLRERQRIHSEMVEYCARGGVAIGDRSLIGDYAFALLQKKRFTAKEWEVYCATLDEYSSHARFRQSDHFFYVDANPDKAMARLRTRGRAGEDGYSMDYLRDLEQAYVNAYAACDITPKHIPWRDKSPRLHSSGATIYDCSDVL